MRTTCSILLLGFLALSGCSSNRQARVAEPQGALIAWDGLGQDPNVRLVRHAHVVVDKQSTVEIEAKEAALAKLREYSREWVALRREIDAAEDARIAKILVICTGCDTAAKPAPVSSTEVRRGTLQATSASQRSPADADRWR
jgi:hypothetical protein